MIETIERFIALESDPLRRGACYHAAATVCRDELKSLDEALDYYNKALDSFFENPERLPEAMIPRALKSFEAIDKVLTTKRDWNAQERAYRDMLGRLPAHGSPTFHKIQVGLFDGLGEIYRSRLKHFESATQTFEIAQQLDPRNEMRSDGTDRAEILAELYPGAEGPSHQIAYQQCPDCRRATQNGAGWGIEVAPEVFERASCDAKVLGSLDAAAPERATTTVTPRLREQVFARDHHRCTVPGCRSARNLDIHPIVPQARGGTHHLWNMTLLCSGHHAALHDGLLVMQGKAPYGVQVHWVYGPPLPVGLDPEARQVLIRQRIAKIFEQMSLKSDPPADAREDARPTRDSGPVGVT